MITTFSSALKEAIRAEMLDLHTSMPGTIKAFDPIKQTVEVQIDLKLGRQVPGDIVTEPIAVLKDVPISYPRANDYSITFPIKPGDTCELKFMERSLDNWLLEGGTVDVEDYRHHSLSDAVAFVGLWDRTNLIKDYNSDQPEFRTGDAKRKVWLDDNKDTGHVEMVDLDNDSRMVLKANGEARMANDKVKTVVEIYPDTKVQMKNPKAKHRMDKYGDILQENLLTSRQMDKFGDIKDKTLLAKHYLKRSGEKYFKNLLAKQIVSSSGSIKYRTLLNKLDIHPGGSAILGGVLNKLNINQAVASLGSSLASIRAIPAAGTVVLQDAAGVITSSIMNKIIGVVGQLAENLGLDIMEEIYDEIQQITDIIALLPTDNDVLDTVRDTISNLLVENSIDLLSPQALDVLRLATNLDNAWNDNNYVLLVEQITELVDTSG